MDRRRGFVALGAVTTLLLVFVWAASAEIPRFTGELPIPDVEPPPPPPPEEIEQPEDEFLWGEDEWDEEPRPELDVNWDVLDRILAVVLAIVILAAVVLAVRQLLIWWKGRQIDRRQPEDDLGDLDAAIAATGESAQLRAATEGDARNAIVACWVALEDAAENAGMVRNASETSQEFTERVLAHWDVDRSTIAGLAALYRRARFSRLDLDAQDRDRALASLERVHAAIVARRDAERAEAERAGSPGGPAAGVARAPGTQLRRPPS